MVNGKEIVSKWKFTAVAGGVHINPTVSPDRHTATYHSLSTLLSALFHKKEAPYFHGYIDFLTFR